MLDNITSSKANLLNLLFSNLLVFTNNLELIPRLLSTSGLLLFIKILFRFLIQICIDTT